MRQFLFVFPLLLIIAGCNTDRPESKEVDPQFAAQYQKGIDALDVNDFTEAERAFQACLKIDVNAHDARMLLARTYIRQQKFALAEETLQTLIGPAETGI